VKTIQLFTVLAALALASSTVVQANDKENEKLSADVKDAMANFKSKDSSFEKAVKKAHGYVIFPRIAKGGFIFGGAGGAGEVYEQGKMVGRAKLSQGTFGAQIGGQVFSEIILFEDKRALDRFKESKFEMSAQVSAVAAAEGVAENAKYAGGVAVLTLPISGLMAEASIGGQKLDFIPLKEE
jgi:lipid-binding SYLF domain-containing protein